MKPDFLIFNGCSFTEGGGLSNPHILNLYGYDLSLDKEYHNIKKELAFSKLVAKHFNCDYVNLAVSANSNKNIFQKVFEYVEDNLDKLENYNNVYCFIQTTMSSRMSVHYKNEELNINTFEKNNNPYTKGEHYDDLQKWYELYIVHFYDEKYEAKHTKSNMYLMREYLKSKNIKPYYIVFSDVELLKILKETDYIKFGGESELMQFAYKNKLRISDEVDNKDGHFSPNGHIEISKILIKKIEND